MKYHRKNIMLVLIFLLAYVDIKIVILFSSNLISTTNFAHECQEYTRSNLQVNKKV